MSAVILAVLGAVLGVEEGLARAQNKQVVKLVKAAQAPPLEKAYGQKGAPITFEVFSDYSCPMCRNLFEQTLRPMIFRQSWRGQVR